MYKLMTPGPTQVRENVRMTRSIKAQNPDIDIDFLEFYKDTCDMFSNFFNTDNEFFILAGEAILGLEAACASLIEKDDKVLVIDNGIYGRYFKDFVEIYGGECTLYSSDYKNTINILELENFIKNSNINFKCATIVHCDTPSGVLNDVENISKMLKKYNILSIVDSVSGAFGIPLSMGDIDILCLGSQKALSAPPGITIIGVSNRAKDIMEKRLTPICSYYANIKLFKDYYQKKWFPYTMPVSDIYAIRKAIENLVNDKNVFVRHKKIGEAIRKSLLKSGLSLYLESGYSDTVTVINLPENVLDDDVISIMRNKYNILITGSFDILKGKVIRIGNMGENANIGDIYYTLYSLTKTLNELDVSLNHNIGKVFIDLINE